MDRLCGAGRRGGGGGGRGGAAVASARAEGRAGHVGVPVTWARRSRDAPQSAEGHVGAAREPGGLQSVGCAQSRRAGFGLRGSGQRPLGGARVAHDARRAGQGAGPGAPVHQLPHPARPGAAQVGRGVGRRCVGPAGRGVRRGPGWGVGRRVGRCSGGPRDQPS